VEVEGLRANRVNEYGCSPDVAISRSSRAAGSTVADTRSAGS
jgi:hypothetical protein